MIKIDPYKQFVSDFKKEEGNKKNIGLLLQNLDKYVYPTNAISVKETQKIKELMTKMSGDFFNDDEKRCIVQAVSDWSMFSKLDNNTRKVIKQTSRLLDEKSSFKTIKNWLTAASEKLNTFYLRFIKNISWENREKVLDKVLLAEKEIQIAREKINKSSESPTEIKKNVLNKLKSLAQAIRNEEKTKDQTFFVDQACTMIETMIEEAKPDQIIKPEQLIKPEQPIKPDQVTAPIQYPISSLVDKFLKRGWDDTLSGYAATSVEHTADQEELKHIIEAHNKVFEDRINLLSVQKGTGYVEKMEEEAETEVFVRADVHGDLGAIMAQLKTFKKEGLLDENYVCKKGFKMVFLGDYMDRGKNEIEVMSLLLTLRMNNPESVVLLRGNHEDIDLQQGYSNEKMWLLSNRGVMEKCYSTFPVALYVAEKGGRTEKNGQKEYAHFSHGMLSLQADPIEFLEKPVAEKTDRFFVLPKTPLGEKRLNTIAQSIPTSPSQVRHKEAAQQLLKARQEESSLGLTNTNKFKWTDLKSLVGVALGIGFNPGRGMQLSPQILQAFSRAGGSKACIKAFMRGHEHNYKEHLVKRKDGTTDKVIAATLAVGVVGGMYKQAGFENEKLQGFLLKVAPRMRNWKKTPFYIEGEKKDAILTAGQAKGMFDQV